MPKVIGSSGKVVTIEVLGIGEVIQRLRKTNQEIKTAADLGVVKAGAFIEEEVKESIMGNRAEVKSVDTGTFANCIEFNKTGDAEGVVKPKNEGYPDSSMTTEDIAKILEYGTSKLLPRSHFGNTKTRNESKVQEIIKEEIVNKID